MQLVIAKVVWNESKTSTYIADDHVPAAKASLSVEEKWRRKAVQPNVACLILKSAKLWFSTCVFVLIGSCCLTVGLHRSKATLRYQNGFKDIISMLKIMLFFVFRCHKYICKEQYCDDLNLKWCVEIKPVVYVL